MSNPSFALTLKEGSALVLNHHFKGDQKRVADAMGTTEPEVAKMIGQACSKWRHPCVLKDNFTAQEHAAAAWLTSVRAVEKHAAADNIPTC